MQLTKILLPTTALTITFGLFACSSSVSPSEGSDDAIASEEDGLEPFIPGFDPGKYSSKTDEPSSSASEEVSSDSESLSSVSEEDSSDSGEDSATSGDGSSASKGDDSASSGDGSSASRDDESSSSEDASSASAGESTIADNGDITAGKDLMDGVDEGTSNQLNENVAACVTAEGCPEGFEELNGGLVVDKDGSGNLDFNSFDENDYYCFSGEGEWLKLDRAKLGEFIPHFKNGAAWGNLSHFEIRFEDLCSAVYIMRK
ncbi:MAG: hypothetical protein IKC23_04255 [Fibrobacter sp.]|nr:hypothetical protein [Fibrobacter sp.]